MKLKEKVAIVTGAASGIGKATAIRFLEEGAKVALVDINVERLQQLEEELHEEFSFNFVAIPCDVAVNQEVMDMVEYTIKSFGRVDVLFNNAGIEHKGMLTQIEPSDWDRVLKVNLSSVYLCSKYVIPLMEKQGGGVIINTASQLGLVGSPEWAVYNAAKGGVINLSKNMAIDYAKKNIRVNAVCPGPIDTPLTERLEKNLSKEDRETFYKELNAAIPMGRLGRADEIASCVLFLASEESSYVTGTILVADGGYVAK